MAVLLNRIQFTEIVEQSLRDGDLGGAQKILAAKRLAIIMALRGDLTKESRRQLTNLQTLLKEQLDVVADLITAVDPQAVWKDEFRFCPLPDGTVACRCGDHELIVGDSFSSSQMLVCTPLTRKTRKALLDAMMKGKLYMAYGPAGTGKTETIKDTARMLGMESLTFNCSDDFETPPDVAFDLVRKQGARCPVIFDEFNRIPVASQDAAVATCGNQFTCLTLNPGYEGRYELSETLKAKMVQQQFVRPDITVIIQVMLGAEGITDCDTLGAKLAACLEACKEKCSKQHHYDFGLRFIKSLVRAIGGAGRASGFSDEAALVAKVLGAELIKRSTVADREIAQAAVKEAFGQDPEVPKAWNTAGHEATAAMVASTLQVRHGVAVVGCVDVAACVAAIENATGAQSLIIEGDASSLHGDAGTFTAAYKAVMESVAPINLILTMPLEAGSLEPLNTVLDDNKVLVTSSGQRLPMNAQTRIVIFVENCGAWSPATVSRVGVVYAVPAGRPAESILGQFAVDQGERIVVKADLNGDIRRLRTSAGALAEFLHAIRSAYDIAPSRELTLKYLDEDGDACTLVDATIADARVQAQAGPLRLLVSVV